jgi:hypothetical protein
MICDLGEDFTKPSVINPAIEEVCTSLISSIQDHYIRITWVIGFHQETKEIQQVFFHMESTFCFLFF